MLLGQQMIRLSKACLGNEEKEAVMEVLSKEFLGMGPKVIEFESKLEDFFNRPVACVTNGTAALHLALQSCGIGKGDEVLVQSLTYVATFQAISATGALPIPCEINESTYTIDLEDCKKKLSPRTKAIMPVHFTGGVGDLDSIYSFAENNKLRVIEDAAHAMGSSYQNKKIGTFGDIACFSFDGIKNITSGEGGCVVTSDQKIINRLKDLRLLGVINDSKSRSTGQRTWLFDVEEQGWRYHMSDIMAAIGIVQLNRLEEFSQKRKYLARKYDELLNSNPRIRLTANDYSDVLPHIYVVRIKNLMNRDCLQKKLIKDGIQTGIHYQPNHLLKVYRLQAKPYMRKTEDIFNELLTLPLHPDLTLDDISFVSQKLELYLKEH